MLSYFGDHWKRGKRERCFCEGSTRGAGGALLLSCWINSLQIRSNFLFCTDKLVEMWQHQNKVKYQNSVIERFRYQEGAKRSHPLLCLHLIDDFEILKDECFPVLLLFPP